MLFGVVAIITIVGWGVYSVARLLELVHYFLKFIVTCAAVAFTLFLLVLSSPDTDYLFVLLWLIVCSWVGSWFHKTSGGKSQSLLNGFFLMFIAAQATLLLSLFAIGFCDSFTTLFRNFSLDDHNYLHLDLGVVFSVLCFTAPMAIAAFLRVFQVMKPRPGFDYHKATEFVSE